MFPYFNATSALSNRAVETRGLSYEVKPIVVEPHMDSNAHDHRPISQWSTQSNALKHNHIGGLAQSSGFDTIAKPRPRGPKRPIPEELKDDKYFEKRSRNNEAAKKSRSSKKDREVEVQERTKLLEGESSFLDAEIANLEREINGLKRQRKLYA